MNETFYRIIFIVGSALLFLSLAVAITSAKLYLGYYDFCKNALYESAETMLRASCRIAMCGTFLVVFADAHRAANVLAAVSLLAIATLGMASRLHDKQIDSLCHSGDQERMKLVEAAFQRNFIEVGLTRSQKLAVCCFAIVLMIDCLLLIVVYVPRW